ncbi:hypothetical protein LJR130_005727 [Variovorax sp. LjRoot130]|uniref:hypothetical protein n=1 Tax=Variovorax sp. LjRoot130 TaxID=3342261 RepID=UPI003ECCF84A
MRLLISFACAATLAAGLVGCGGGGGGGGGSGFSAPAALTATVSINGSAATADANGQFAVKPGDTVEITPSQSADWTTSASSEAAVSLRNPSVSGSKWAAQILNGTASAVSYTVSAKASANQSLTKATVLNVSAGDARNGTYRVYAANALQYQLTLDFNANVYTFVNQDGSAPVADTFNTDSSEAGTYFFKTGRVTSVANTSRFRMTTDAVVGNFPFVDPFGTGSTYAVKPFIGARNLVTEQAQLDGVYNRLGIQRTAAAETSQITQTEVSSGGTVMKLCFDSTIYSIPNCPPASVATYTVSATEIAGVWHIVNNANPAENGRFAMARIGDQKVYLSAGAAPSTPGMLVWRLGVQDTPVWAAATGHGGSTKGSWASINMTATGNTRIVINADGTTAAHANTYGGMGAFGPAGMRQFPDGTGSTYFATYNTKLFTIVGASNVTTGGYLQLNLLD